MSERTTRRLLVVEDNPIDRASLRRLLGERPTHYDIVEARSGEDAAEALQGEHRFDCVLLDYYLPDMRGDELLLMLRQMHPDAPLVPIVMITGVDDASTAGDVLRRGAQDYVVKGTFTGQGLARAIENAIDKFAYQRELEQKQVALELRNWQLEALRSELQQKLAELADATKAKDQFMAVMSHEMRTPLNAILGYAELLEMEMDGALTSGQRRHLERIRVGGRHLLDLINDVLDLARTHGERLDLDMRNLDVRAVLEEVVALLEREADTRGLKIELDIPPDVPRAHADLQRLRQVLINLIGNAIKFTERGGVVIRVRPIGEGGISIVVEDSGIGIAREALPLVFDEFFQADHELTRKYGGSGLGLAVSRRLVRLMGGEIEVESELGRGSAFTIRLPAADASAIQRRMVQRNVYTAGADEEPAASVVAFADDANGLTMLEERLRPRVKLTWTTNAEEVLTLVRESAPSLVVLDITSGQGSAWRIASAMQDADLPSVAMLLLPGIPDADESDVPGALDLGWITLVPKPYTPEQLTGAVSHAARHGPNGARVDVGGHEVLVVDDDEDSRRVAAAVLREANARVREAEDGEGALIAMRRRVPDVVILDLMMPVLDGFGVLAAMRADPMLRGVPVVVLSAKMLSSAEREFLARTAARVLQKGEHRLGDVAMLVLRAVETRTGVGT